MSLRLAEARLVVGRYVGLLEQSEAVRAVIEGWGLVVGVELKVGRKVMGELGELLAEGVEEI